MTVRFVPPLALLVASALACTTSRQPMNTPPTAARPAESATCEAAVMASLPPEVPAVFAQPGWTKAALPDRSCIFGNVRPVNGWRGYACTRLLVGVDGRASEFAVVGTPVPEEQVQVFRSAVASCRFVPARDAEGRPAATWLILPLRID